MATHSCQSTMPREHLQQQYLACRAHSLAICEPLQDEDTCIQTMPDVSPPKWHLAHTSWFFETFLLQPYLASYAVYHPQYDFLFNSYYVTHGNPYPRPRRGLLSRPTRNEVLAYRDAVDAAMVQLLGEAGEVELQQIAPLLILGINHEQQHQELLYTDIKHIFAQNPLLPAYRPAQTPLKPVAAAESGSDERQWLQREAGIVSIGHSNDGFAYDNEGPRHDVLLQSHAIADRLVSNAEYLAFMQDGGYTRPEFWMSEGWACVQQQAWQAPLYWQAAAQDWQVFGLEGLQPLDLQAPVCHVSFYEADAYARWCGARLPTEFEWEATAVDVPVAGNLREQDHLQPVAAGGQHQFYGDVWEWTASPYTAYPRYRPAAGSIGEYNGKFMSSQMVLRGGSCVTPADHIRASYRNFFYPPDRWQFSGIRLAQDPD